MRPIKILKGVAAAALLTLPLSGCMHFNEMNAPMPSIEKMTKETGDILRKTPDIVKIPLPKGAFVLDEMDLSIPVEKDVMIDVEFGDARVDQIVYAVAKESGLGAIYYADTTFSTSTGTSSTTSSSTPKRVSISFKGRVSDFLKSISQSTGIFLKYENNTIVARETSQFSVPIPAYSEVMKEVSTNITGLGAGNVSFDRVTSTLSFSADANAYRRIHGFLARLKDNAALITMQVIVMNVKLTKGSTRGIDWSKIAWNHRLLNNNTAGGSTATTGTTITSGDTTVSTGSNLWDYGASLAMNSTGAGFVYTSAEFSMQALMNFMESQGRYEIMQNFFTQTMSGSKGVLDVLTETPYVSSISISSLSNNSSSTAQTANTATAKQGVQLTVVPYYAKKEGTVSIQLNIAVLGVTRYLTLDAGNQLGKLTQPETTKKNIDSFVRMTPSQVAVLGGLVYDRTSGDMSGLPTDTYLTKSLSRDTEKEELVVVVKPTVIEFVSTESTTTQKTAGQPGKP